MLPGSESDLARLLPGSNQPNVFPRQALLGDEKVVFEIRPGLLSLHPVVIVLGSIYLGFFGLIVAATAVVINPGVAAAEFIVLLGPAILVVGWAVYTTRATAYALTDRRVIAHDRNAYRDAPLDEIRSVSLKGNRLVFELGRVSPGSSVPVTTGLKIDWYGVAYPTAVLPFVQSAVAFYRIQRDSEELRDRLTSAEMKSKIVCAFCGLPVDVSKVDQRDPRCPNCAAPLTIKPSDS